MIIKSPKHVKLMTYLQSLLIPDCTNIQILVRTKCKANDIMYGAPISFAIKHIITNIQPIFAI